MHFWRKVSIEIFRQRWFGIAILLLGVIHTVFTGVSVASFGCLLLILLLSKTFWKWCSDQKVAPMLLGIICALALVFLIETYLGVSTRIFGALSPPSRQPVLFEKPLIWTLGWLYQVRPGQYIELALIAFPVVAVIYAVLHLHNRRNAQKHAGIRKSLELLRKCLESISGFTLIAGALVFANAVNLTVTGLNSFAALYEKESRQLGTNTDAIDKLKKQLENLKELDDGLTREPVPPNVQPFMNETGALIDALWQLEQAKIEASRINLATYKADQDPISSLNVSLSPSPSEPPDAEIGMKVLLRFSKFATLQQQAIAAQRKADELLKQRDNELVNSRLSILLALNRAQRLAPPEKAKLLTQIAQSLVSVVAVDGIEGATKKIHDLAAQEQHEASNQRQANEAYLSTKHDRLPASRHSQIEVENVRETSKQQPLTAINNASAVLEGQQQTLVKRVAPGSAILKQYEAFVMHMKTPAGNNCGSAEDSVGMVIQKSPTDDLEITDQNGNLHPDPSGTHYHVKLTTNKAGELLPNGGFWMDLPDEVVLHADAARGCSARLDGKKCNYPPFNVIWTNNNYPTQDNPNLRPIVKCFWPTPLVM
jgi:hypothetical protein